MQSSITGRGRPAGDDVTTSGKPGRRPGGGGGPGVRNSGAKSLPEFVEPGYISNVRSPGPKQVPFVSRAAFS